MKNVIKKIAAVAMAFTLFGTGTTISKTVNPKSTTTLSAHAACNHVPRSTPRVVDYGWTYEYTSGLWSVNPSKVYSRKCAWVCTKCGLDISNCKQYKVETYISGWGCYTSYYYG